MIKQSRIGFIDGSQTLTAVLARFGGFLGAAILPTIDSMPQQPEPFRTYISPLVVVTIEDDVGRLVTCSHKGQRRSIRALGMAEHRVGT